MSDCSPRIPLQTQRPLFKLALACVILAGSAGSSACSLRAATHVQVQSEGAQAPAPAPCLASANWITQPSMPPEVATSESFCDFYQFSWQWFLAQVSPSSTSGERVFEGNRVLDPTVKTGQCALPPITGRAAASKRLAVRGVKPQDFESEQADGNPLYDQNGNILYYNVWYSQAECQSTPSGFAPGTMEIKTSWRVLPQPDPTYFTMQATLPGGSAPVTLGLVGFHLANWTSKHPEMIWATWEHKSNAPLCDGSSSTPASGWSFTSAAAAQCLASNPQSAPGTISPNCLSFNYNSSSFNGSGTPSPTGTPDQVCRLYANGNDVGVAVNGNDNAANLAAIQQLNAALNGPQGLLTALPSSDPMAIWQNYEMIGGIWTKGGAPSGNPPVPNTYYAADPTSLQRGSLQLANMTMETFQQGEPSQIPNCFGCHNYTPSTPLGVSHIERKLFTSIDVCAGQAFASNVQAQAGCPAICRAKNLTFKGDWTNAPTNVAAAHCRVGAESVCGCFGP